MSEAADVLKLETLKNCLNAVWDHLIIVEMKGLEIGFEYEAQASEIVANVILAREHIYEAQKTLASGR